MAFCEANGRLNAGYGRRERRLCRTAPRNRQRLRRREVFNKSAEDPGDAEQLETETDVDVDIGIIGDFTMGIIAKVKSILSLPLRSLVEACSIGGSGAPKLKFSIFDPSSNVSVPMSPTTCMERSCTRLRPPVTSASKGSSFPMLATPIVAPKGSVPKARRGEGRSLPQTRRHPD